MPALYLNSANYIGSRVDSVTNGNYGQDSSIVAFTSNWVHASVSAFGTTLRICVTLFDSTLPVTTCVDKTNIAEAIYTWSYTNVNAKVIIGGADGSNTTYPGFEGKTVDVRYYPSRIFTQTEINTLIKNRKCVEEMAGCYGPDNSSVKKIRLTPGPYKELRASNSPNIGQGYF